MPYKASVIIPTYNCSQLLEKSLEALFNQTLDSTVFEILVIDDGSADDTPFMVKKFVKNNFIYIQKEHSGRSKTRNEGIRNASGEILIFIDSDVIVTPSFVEEHINAYIQDEKKIVSGTTFNIPDIEKRNKPGLLSSYSKASFPTGNCSAKKKFILQAGLFDEEFTEYGWEDQELGHRLMALGLKKTFAKKAIGFHIKPPNSYSSLPSQISKEKERGRMAVIFYRKDPTFRTRISTLYSPVFFLIERLINIGHWSKNHKIDKLLMFFDSKGYRRLFSFIAGFRLLSSYFEGMREAHDIKQYV